MKHTPIENPRFTGCLTCGRVPPKIWPERRKIVIYGMVTLDIDGKQKHTYLDSEVTTLYQLRKKHQAAIDKAECVTVDINTPLHGEIYELNKDDGKWYLVRQHQGFA